MTFPTPKPITLQVAKMAMPDPVPQWNREYDQEQQELHRKEQERDQRVLMLADHLFRKEFVFVNVLDGLADCDQQNADKFMELLRSEDMAEFGLQIKNMIEAYAYRVAEYKCG